MQTTLRLNNKLGDYNIVVANRLVFIVVFKLPSSIFTEYARVL